MYKCIFSAAIFYGNFNFTFVFVCKCSDNKFHSYLWWKMSEKVREWERARIKRASGNILWTFKRKRKSTLVGKAEFSPLASSNNALQLLMLASKIPIRLFFHLINSIISGNHLHNLLPNGLGQPGYLDVECFDADNRANQFIYINRCVHNFLMKFPCVNFNYKYHDLSSLGLILKILTKLVH